jgi:hypothetical protein
MERRTLAREWLWLFGCFAGVGAFYLYVWLADPWGRNDAGRMASSYLPVATVLYGIIQAIRATAWAIRNVTGKKPN